MSNAIDPSQVQWDAPVAVAPAIDPNAVKWDTPALDASSAKKGGILGGIAMGVRDPIDAGAQLLRRAVPDWIGKPVDAFGNYLAEHGFPVTPSEGVSGVDNVVKNANADYDASRQMAGRDGFDLARIGGNIVNPVNWAVPMGGAATTLAGIAGRGAAQGVVSGLMTPVTNTDNFWQQKFEQGTVGGATGGILAPAAHSVSQVGTDLGARIRGTISGTTQAVVDATIARAAQTAGIDLSQIHPADLANVRQQVTAALSNGRDLDTAAAIRMAEGERVLGADANLTLGQATRDPKQFTTEKNLRGAPGGEPLMTRYNAQSGALVNALNDAGATGAPGVYQTGDRLINALRGANDNATANVSSLYDKANALNGGAVPLDSAAFANAADALLNPLGKVSVTRFLPSEIKNYLNDVSSGDLPLNVSTAENLKTIMATAQRNATDGNVKNAIGKVRDALEQTQPIVKTQEPFNGWEPDDFLESIEPPHGVTDKSKLDAIQSHMEENGWVGRPVLAYQDASGANFALTGSHRISAAKRAGVDIPVVYTEDGTNNFQNADGHYLSDISASGDDDVLNFLKESGDQRAASLMKEEVEAVNEPTVSHDGADVINAFKTARLAHASRIATIDSNPALAASVDGVQPDKFFSKYVLNGNARDLQSMTSMLSDSADGAPAPSIIGDIRKEIVSHLKTKALSGAEDDVGTFSQAGYKKALDNIGDDRLSAFFTPEEIDGLHRVARVASNAQVAPAGNAVNTSNTASAAYTFLGGLLKNLPFASAISKGANDAGTKINVGNALSGKVPAKAPEAAVNALRPLLTPFAGAGAAASSELVQ